MVVDLIFMLILNRFGYVAKICTVGSRRSTMGWPWAEHWPQYTSEGGSVW